jgi:transcriptional/translational regulatory protein YebC/TACO1
MIDREWETTIKSDVFKNFMKLALTKKQDEEKLIKSAEEKLFESLKNLDQIEQYILSSEELTNTFKNLQTKFATMKDNELNKIPKDFVEAVKMLCLP